MVICGKCGSDNDPGARQCRSCGGLLESPSSGAPPPPPGSFARDVSEIGKRIGEDVGRAGEKFGKEMERKGTEIGVWWDRSLGIFSPIVIGFFGVIGYLVAILVVGVIAEVSDRPLFWNHLLDFLEEYWWLFFLLAFYGAFQNYSMRRYKPLFKWVNPVVSAFGCVIWLWIFAQVLNMAEVDRGHTNLGALGEFIEDFLWVIFALVLIGGYLFAILQSSRPDNKKSP